MSDCGRVVFWGLKMEGGVFGGSRVWGVVVGCLVHAEGPPTRDGGVLAGIGRTESCPETQPFAFAGFSEGRDVESGAPAVATPDRQRYAISTIGESFVQGSGSRGLGSSSLRGCGGPQSRPPLSWTESGSVPLVASFMTPTDSLVDCCTIFLPVGNSEERPPPKQPLPQGCRRF